MDRTIDWVVWNHYSYDVAWLDYYIWLMRWQCWFGRGIRCEQVGEWKKVYTYMGVCYSYILSMSLRSQFGLDWIVFDRMTLSHPKQMRKLSKRPACSTTSTSCWWRPSPFSIKKTMVGRFSFTTGNRHLSSIFELTAVHFTTDGAKTSVFTSDRWT